MAQIACKACGRSFFSKKSTASFCSQACKKAAYRHRMGERIMPDRAIMMVEREIKDTQNAISEARRVSNELARLSQDGPEKLRGGCLRISHAITKAIDEEGW